MSTYPCPACGASANLTDGCPGCHRPPDPDAAEAVTLAARIPELTAQVAAARAAYGEASQRLSEAINRHNELAQRIQARRAAQPPPAAPPTPPPARPESSGRTVQNVLFVLGGLLLGSAAIVFAAVAWANVGVPGRAVILAAVTMLTLAVPPLVLRRGLTGTAETFAALGLLLTLLDGYAAWAVNLADVTTALSPTRYAGLVFAVTAALGLAYRRVTRLTGPGYAALALAQPVPLLLVAGTGLGPAGWSATLSAAALANVAAARWIRATPLRIVAWAFAGYAAVAALVSAAMAGLVGSDVPGAARAAVALVLVALIVVAAAAVARGLTWLPPLAGGVLVGAVFLGAGRVLALTLPDLRLAPHAALVVLLAVLVRALPARLRTGPRIAVLAAAGVVAVLPALAALGAGGSTAAVAWGGELGPTAARVDWWEPVPLALAALAAAVLLPARVRLIPPVVALVLIAFAVPRSVPLPWWGPSIVDGLVVVPLAVLAARTRRSALSGGAALLLVGHAVLVGLGRAQVSAIVLGAVLVLATGTAVLARDNPAVRAVAAAIGLVVPTGLGAAYARYAGLPVPPFAVLGLVLATGAVLARRTALRVGVIAIPLAGLGAVVAALPDGRYLAVPVLCDVLVGVAVLPALAQRRRTGYLAGYLLLGVPAALPPVAAALPATAELLLGPYQWLSAIWTGRPQGPGVVPVQHLFTVSGRVFGFGPVALSLAAGTLAVAVTGLPRGGWKRSAGWAAVPASLAVLAGTAALDAPWPTIAAVSLAIGVGAALVAALRPVPGLAPLAVATGGAGLAGALPTAASTLAALATVVVTATVCAVAGRFPAARVAGWLVAVPAGALLAFAAARAADVAVPASAFWVLGAAALALGVSGWLRRAPEKTAVESSAHAAAAVALLLTIGTGRYPAAVLALWGVAIGLRALWPGEPVPARQARIVAGVAGELVAYWLLLWIGGVALTEAYTVPAAGVALLAGWLAARTRPELHSWTAYGPALLAGFGPSLALVLAVPGEPVRRLLVGLAAVAVVVAGALRRRQAPVVVGGTALGVIALHESVLVWDLLPRWIPLALAGLLLVGLAITYERRRRDLGRLRTAVARMR